MSQSASVYACLLVCVCACLCMCVCYKEREEERGGEKVIYSACVGEYMRLCFTVTLVSFFPEINFRRPWSLQGILNVICAPKQDSFN